MASGGDGAALLGGGQIKQGAGAPGKLRKSEGVGAPEMILPLGDGEDLPVGGGNPVDAGKVWGGSAAFEFEELGILHGSNRKGDYRLAGANVGIKGDQGKHLAADGLVTYPEDKVVAPPHRFYDVR